MLLEELVKGYHRTICLNSNLQTQLINNKCWSLNDKAYADLLSRTQEYIQIYESWINKIWSVVSRTGSKLLFPAGKKRRVGNPSDCKVNISRNWSISYYICIWSWIEIQNLATSSLNLGLPLPWDAHLLFRPSWLLQESQYYEDVLQACCILVPNVGNGHTMEHISDIPPTVKLTRQDCRTLDANITSKLEGQSCTSRRTSFDSSKTISSKLVPTTIFTSPSFCHQVRKHVRHETPSK